MRKVDYGVIADVHFGGPPTKKLKKELEIFLDEFRKSTWKVLFIAGDLFHRKMSGNSPDMIEALRFMGQVFQIAKEKGTKIRIIHGTLSHDSEQLELISAMDVALDVDLKIFNTVDDEEIFPDFNVLYLPEEYITDMDSYYSPYFAKKYDMVIGHGLVDKAAFIASVQESEETRKAAPIFAVKKLHEICHGPIYFGHVHRRMLIDRFRYVSSYSVWAFGEPESKGFIKGTYYLDEQYFEDFFVENNLCPRYDIVKISEDSPLYTVSPQEAIMAILSTVKDVLRDNVRIEMIIPDSYAHTNLLIDMVNEAIKGKPIKTKIIATIKEKMVEKIRSDVEELMERYKIIFDRNVPEEVKLSEFIRIEKDVYIPAAEIKNLLEEKII